jgi:hypothetical protein
LKEFGLDLPESGGCDGWDEYEGGEIEDLRILEKLGCLDLTI